MITARAKPGFSTRYAIRPAEYGVRRYVSVEQLIFDTKDGRLV